MPLDLLVNANVATVTAGGTTAPVAGTSEGWTVTCTGWPVLGASQQFRVIDEADLGATSGYEIMLVTASANGTGVAWTVTRGAEGTTPKAHSAGWTAIPAGSAQGIPNACSVAPMGAAGMYLFTPQATSDQGSNNPTAGIIVFVPISITQQLTVSAIGVGIQVAGSTGDEVRLGLYTSEAGVPATLLVDAGVVATTLTGWVEIAIASLVLQPGTYWAACVSQGGATTQAQIYSARSTIAPHGAGFSASPGGGLQFSATGYSGALPATLPGAFADWGTGQSANYSPNVGLKIGAI